MELSTFWILLGYLLVFAVIIRLFWKVILIVGIAILTIVGFIFMSWFTALIFYMIFDGCQGPGFNLLWIFFSIFYIVLYLLIYLISVDIVNMVVSFIQKLFR
jgi:hypothetical protein